MQSCWVLITVTFRAFDFCLTVASYVFVRSAALETDVVLLKIAFRS